jgi:hypothetical protein
VSLLVRATGATSPILVAVDVVLAYLALVGLARPVIHDARLTEAVALLPDALQRPVRVAALAALAAGAIVGLVAVAAWDQAWFGARSPFSAGMTLQGLGLQILAVGCLLVVTGLAAFRR